MKKSFALVLALVLLISGTAIYAQTALLKEKDQVHFTESVSYGDKSVVEGVQVEMYNYYDNKMFWHTTYEFGAKEKEKTDYEFYPWYHEQEQAYEGAFWTVTDYISLSTGGYMEEKEYRGVEAALKELYDKTPAGGKNQMIIRLKDYMDYYTFGFELSLPHAAGETHKDYQMYSVLYIQGLAEEIEYYEESGENSEYLQQLKVIQKDWENFNEFFKIPVIESEIAGVAIAKDANGRISGMGSSNVNGASAAGDADLPGIYNIEGLDGFNMWFEAIFDNGDCYLTFDPHTVNGYLVDTSEIPGGFGIYHFSYDNKKGTIDSENIQMVYALNPQDKIVALKIDASGEHLLLETIEMNRTYLSVIKRDTMELVQKLDMGVTDYLAFDSYEDFMVTRSEELAVYTKDAQGLYQKEFGVNINEMERQLGVKEDEVYVSWSGVYDWNGQTLLIASNLFKECSFFLTAVDETGLLYYGEYQSSLNTGDEEYYSCYPDHNKEDKVLVHWGK